VKNRLLAGVALSALFAGSATAADMPVKAPPPPVAVFSWTGFYVGLNAGGAWGRSDAETSVTCAAAGTIQNYFCSNVAGAANASAVNAAGTGSLSGSAFIGGGQIGFNVQNGGAVFGVEVDAQSFNLRASRQASGTFPVDFPPGISAGTTFTVTSSVNTDWLLTARGRVGWAFDNVLAYATGGVAVTTIRASHTYADNFVAPPGGAGAWNGSATKVGYAVGGGVEWAAARSWTVKIEYLYLNFGSVNAAGTIFNPDSGGYAQAIATSVDLTAHIARAGINFKF
jgi:outer membrane immunogenic protein